MADTVVMSARLINIGVPNSNGRVYDDSAVDSILNGPKEVLGSLGMPDDSRVALSSVSHVVKNFAVKDDWLVGDVSIAGTESGKILEGIIDKMVFRPAGVGSVNKDGVIEKFKLVSFCAIPVEDDVWCEPADE